MPRRSPLTSVTSALSIATSVPVPIAMPTSAAAKAGASLIPSPATGGVLFAPPPRHRPPPAFAAERFDEVNFVGGLDLGLPVIDAQFGRDGTGCSAIVASAHNHADSELMKIGDPPGGGFFDRICHGERPRHA